MLHSMRYKSGEVKPLYRGVFHEASIALFAVYGAILVLWASTRGTDQTHRIVSAVVFPFGTLLCFLVSAVYHRKDWKTAQAENVARRFDHMCINVLHFCNGLPIALLVYSYPARVTWFAVSGTVALVGIAYSWYKAIEELDPGEQMTTTNRLASVMYCVLVLSQFMFAHQVFWWTPGWVFGLWVTSYIIEGLGALAYQLHVGDTDKWWCFCPPADFSSHEIFHLCTILGQLMLCVVHFDIIAIR